MTARQGTILKGEGPPALAFVLSGLLAAVILLPSFQLLDLKFSAACFLAAVALPAWASADREQLLKVWRWSALGLAAYALLQRLGLEPIAAYAQAGSRQRAMGTYGNASYLAAFLVLTWPLFLAWEGWKRGAALLLLFAALAATQSRAGLLAVLVQLCFLLPVLRKIGWSSALVLIPAAGLLGWLFPFAEWSRSTWRLDLWYASFQVFLQKPFFGWGWGAFPGAIQAYLNDRMAQALAGSGQYAEDPHQVLLTVACAYGLAGLLVFGFLIFKAFRWILASDEPFSRYLGLGLLGLLMESQVDRFFFQAGVLGPLLLGLVMTKKTKIRLWLGLALALPLAWWGLRPLLNYHSAVGASMDQGVEALASTASLSELVNEARQSPSPGAWDRLAAAYASKKDYGEAAQAYFEAHRLQPSRARAQNWGNCLMMLKRPKEAEMAYHQAVRLEPQSADAHFSLGYALYHQNRIKEALAELNVALKLDPNHAGAAKLKEQILP